MRVVTGRVTTLIVSEDWRAGDENRTRVASLEELPDGPNAWW